MEALGKRKIILKLATLSILVLYDLAAAIPTEQREGTWGGGRSCMVGKEGCVRAGNMDTFLFLNQIPLKCSGSSSCFSHGV